MDHIIYLRRDAFWKIRPYGSILYKLRDFTNRLKLNDVASFFISQIDGQRTIADIAQVAAMEFEVPVEVVEKDCHQVMDMLSQKEMVTFDPALGKAVELEQLEPTIDVANIRVTNGCNFRCIHCFPNSSKVGESELTKEELIHLIDELARFKVLHVTFTGGEPFLRKDLVDIVEHANSKGMLVSICTNASLMTDETIERLAQCAIASLKVSMDGASAETHDKYRGQGKFDELIPKIKKLVAAGLPVCINSVISRVNFHEYKQILDLARDLNVYEFAFDYIRKMGRAAGHWDDVSLSMDQQVEFLTYYNSKFPKYGSVNMGSVFYPEIVGDLLTETNATKACNVCLASIVILSSGDVTACWRLYDTMGFTVGNLREKPLMEIWRDAELFHKLRELDIQDIEKCKDCNLNSFCDASCRGWALPIHGDWYGAPPEDKCRQKQIILLNKR